MESFNNYATETPLLWQGPLTEKGQSSFEQRLDVRGATSIEDIAELREDANITARIVERSELRARQLAIALTVGRLALTRGGVL